MFQHDKYFLLDNINEYIYIYMLIRIIYIYITEIIKYNL